MVQKAEKSRTVTAKQELFLLEYIRLPTLISACTAVGITDDTGRRWLRQPEIMEAYQEMRRRYLDEALAALISLTRTAITTLGRNMSADSPPGVQVRAAQLVLEQSIDLNKMSRLEEQIGELKELIERRKL